ALYNPATDQAQRSTTTTTNMKTSIIAILLNLALMAAAIPYAEKAPNGGPPFDDAGKGNVGNGKGKQFITGQCLSNADCASGCCAGPSGICSGPAASFQSGKTGCGFVSKSGKKPKPTPSKRSPQDDDNGDDGGDTPTGGDCNVDSDCESGCCLGGGCSTRQIAPDFCSG
ncbi:hypothetical protein FGG08_006371, partial [Glutinoglossum americanum]